MKRIPALLISLALGACASREPKPPRVGTASLAENFNNVESSANSLDAIAIKMEEHGQ